MVYYITHKGSNNNNNNNNTFGALFEHFALKILLKTFFYV